MVDIQVNTLCLNTDYVLRTGPFDHPADKTAIQSQSLSILLYAYCVVKNKLYIHTYNITYIT